MSSLILCFGSYRVRHTAHAEKCARLYRESVEEGKLPALHVYDFLALEFVDGEGNLEVLDGDDLGVLGVEN